MFTVSSVFVGMLYLFKFHVSNRFATELAGRKARRHNWNGLADEMTGAGWFD